MSGILARMRGLGRYRGWRWRGRRPHSQAARPPAPPARTGSARATARPSLPWWGPVVSEGCEPGWHPGRGARRRGRAVAPVRGWRGQPRCRTCLASVQAVPRGRQLQGGGGVHDEEGRGGRALLVSGDGRAWASCCQINHRHSSLWLGEDADEEVVEHPVLRCLYGS